MENYENYEVAVVEKNNAVTEQNKKYLDLTNDALFVMAEQAKKRIQAIKTIIEASLAMTNESDWCLINGNPYLQETGASKVARSFGVSWRMEKPEVLVDERGYKTFIFKGLFMWQGAEIEAEGSRSMKEDFFSRVVDKEKSTKEKVAYKMKSPDEIDERDVRMAAYTNCINNGIKRIIPGLRNTKLETLKDAGLEVDKISGYDHKKNKADPNAIKCEVCGAEITSTVAEFSQKNYSKNLCMKCQKAHKADASAEK